MLKAIMKLSKVNESSITPLKIIDMSGLHHSSSDYGAIGRDDLSQVSPSHNVSADRSMLFGSFLGSTKRISFGEDHKVKLSSREQNWLASYFTLLGRNRQDYQLLARDQIRISKKHDCKRDYNKY